MAEWKTVTIFVVVCCAISAARGTIVSADGSTADVTASSSSDSASPFAVGQVILASADDSNATSDWTLPANLRIDRPISYDLQPSSMNATMGSDPQAAIWTSPALDLAAPSNASTQSLRSGDLPVGGDAITAMPIASVAIPLPPALPATAALLIPAGFLALSWKKSRHPRD